MSVYVCDRCGAFADLDHGPVDGDCILPHRLDLPEHPPTATTGQVCITCIARHREWLEEIDELLDAIGKAPSDTAAVSGEKQHHRKSQSAPAPVRLDAFAMTTDTRRLFANAGKVSDYLRETLPDVYAVLRSWAANAADDGAPPHHLATVTHYLADQAEFIATRPWLREYHDELAWIRRTLRAAAGITTTHPLGKCLSLTGGGRQCRGNVWPGHGRSPRCERCGRVYRKLDLVRLKLNEQPSVPA